MFKAMFGAWSRARYNSASAYTRHLNSSLRAHRGNRDLAFAKAIGSDSVELFNCQGDGQVALLRHHGLADGMAVYDLGCGCGRTAQALQRSGWRGSYTGADIVAGLVSELKRKCPGYSAVVQREPSVVAADHSLDMLFHWSVFTHITLEECYPYLEDSFRALKPGAQLIFSFLELTDPNHYRAIFENRIARMRRKRPLKLIDTFLHRDWIAQWAENIGFEQVAFTDGSDASRHPPMWQTVATMVKPA